ncbi:MAG: sortase [Solirubrobacteraceae bacterium]|nr:sortase [Solirubrobacteraceae bacterium]
MKSGEECRAASGRGGAGWSSGSFDGVKLAPPRPLDGPTPKSSAARASSVALPPSVVRRGGFGGRRAQAARRALRGLAILFGLAGVLALSDGVVTLVWQEPVSGLLAHFSQSQLAKSLKALERQRPTAADTEALNGLPTDQQRMAYFARNLQQTARPAQAVGTILIPRIGANFVVVAGTAAASLQKGPGIYSGTSVPGLPGTVGIAGHRTTYLAPFRRINELTSGDLITLQMPYGVFTYTVTGHEIVAPNDISVLRPTGYAQVVLTACNPLYSASQRLAVFARLTSSVPSGLALSTLIPQTPGVVTPGVVRPAINPGAFVPSVLGAALATGIAPYASLSGPLPKGQTDAIIVGPVTAAGVRALGKAAGPAPKPKTPAASPRPTPGAVAPAITTAPAVRRPAVTSPTYIAPRQPIGISLPVRPRQPVTPVRSPASAPRTPSNNTATSPSSKPTTNPSSSTTTPSTGQTQTRVQGQPGGPAPIIGTSGG